MLILCATQVQAKTLQKNPLFEQYLTKCAEFMGARKLDSVRYLASIIINETKNPTDPYLAKALYFMASASSSNADALKYFHLSRLAAIQSNENKILFKSYLNIGGMHRRELRYDSTRYYYKLALNLSEKMLLENRTTDNLRLLATINNNYAAHYTEIEEFSKAAPHLVEAEKIGREIKDTMLITAASINAGAVYTKLGSDNLSNGKTQILFLNKAMQYFKIALSMLSPKQELFYSTVLNNMGSVYVSLNKQDSAIYYFEKALPFFIKSEANDRICSCHFSMGSIFSNQKQYNKANLQFDEAIAIGEKYSLNTCLVPALINKGNLLTETNNLEAAEKALTRALGLKTESEIGNEHFQIYESLYRLYVRKNDFEKALAFYKKSIAAKDEISDIEHLNVLDEMDIRYKSEKQSDKIDELNLEKLILEEKNRNKEAQLKLNELWLIALIVLLLMLVILIVFWVQRNNIKLKQSSTDLENKLLRARMNPHFLFNGLNTIQKHYADGATEEAHQFMVDFNTFLQLILNKTGETTHSLTEEISFTSLYVSLEQRKYPDKIKYDLQIAPGLQTENWMVPSMLLQPIVENAIWHGILPSGIAGEIVLKLYEKSEDELVCEISDNGIGYDVSVKNKNGKHVSKAFELIEKRLGKNGTLQIETINNAITGQSGTKIKITLNSKL